MKTVFWETGVMEAPALAALDARADEEQLRRSRLVEDPTADIRETVVRHITAARPISARGLAAVLDHRWVAVLLCALAALKLLMLWGEISAPLDPEDFGIYYLSAQLLHHGANPYLTDLGPPAARLGFDPGVATRATDPPAFLLAVEPLTMLPLEASQRVWFAINLGALLLAIFLLLGREESGLTGTTALSLAVLALLFPPVGNNLVDGQSKTQILLLLVIMIRMLDRKRERAAGLMLAAAGLLRVFPLLLLGYFLIRRRWRVVTYTIVGLAVGGLVTMFAAGVSNSLAFLFHAPAFLTRPEFLSNPCNISINAVISRGFWFVYGPILDWWPRLACRAAVVAADLAIFALVARATPSPRHDDHDWRALSLWTLAAVTLTPTAWFFDLSLMLIPFLLMASAVAKGTVSGRAYAMAAGTYFLAVAIGVETTLLMPGSTMISAWIENLDFAVLGLGFLATLWFSVDRWAASRSIEKPSESYRRFRYDRPRMRSECSDD